MSDTTKGYALRVFVDLGKRGDWCFYSHDEQTSDIRDVMLEGQSCTVFLTADAIAHVCAINFLGRGFAVVPVRRKESPWTDNPHNDLEYRLRDNRTGELHQIDKGLTLVGRLISGTPWELDPERR